MLTVLVGISVWIFAIVVAGIGFLALSSPGMAALLETLLVWGQAPVIYLTISALVEEGIPGGLGELRDAVEWATTEGGDIDDAPVNFVVVALELGAATLAVIGLVFSGVFSTVIAIGSVGTFGQGFNEPSTLSIGTLTASEAFLIFLTGAVLWQVAWLLEGVFGN